MQPTINTQLLLKFQSEYQLINDLKIFFDFLEIYYRVKEVELYSTINPTKEQIESFIPANPDIDINDYRLEIPNTLNFRNFRFDFTQKIKFLLQALFEEKSKSYTEKITYLESIEKTCEFLIHYHDIEDSVSLVKKLIFNIRTRDDGILTIQSFGRLIINEDVFKAMKYDFDLRRYFFREAKIMIAETKDKINIHETTTNLQPENEKENDLKYLIYEFAEGIKEMQLINFDTTTKNDLENKLFKVFNINGGKRSDYIYNTNARANGNRGHYLNKMVKAINGKTLY